MLRSPGINSDRNMGTFWSIYFLEVPNLFQKIPNGFYIVAGGEGKDKAISEAGSRSEIADGRVAVPKYTWKVILVIRPLAKIFCAII